METKKLSYSDVLNETIEFYSKNPRCESHDKCEYRIVGIPNSCAFGRYINDLDKFLKENPEYNTQSAIIVLKDFGFDILKEEVKDLKSLDFWNDIQRLHDRNEFWISDGLSERGKRHVEIFNATIKNNEYAQQE